MAVIARPTWAEVQEMDQTTRTAMAIVKGQANGEEYDWTFEGNDPETGKPMMGAWKSWIEKNKGHFRGRDE